MRTHPALRPLRNDVFSVYMKSYNFLGGGRANGKPHSFHKISLLLGILGLAYLENIFSVINCLWKLKNKN